jgi:hypothetical protein
MTYNISNLMRSHSNQTAACYDEANILPPSGINRWDRKAACVRACVRARVRACVHACVHECVHECVRACVRACMRIANIYSEMYSTQPALNSDSGVELTF